MRYRVPLNGVTSLKVRLKQRVKYTPQKSRKGVRNTKLVWNGKKATQTLPERYSAFVVTPWGAPLPVHSIPRKALPENWVCAIRLWSH